MFFGFRVSVLSMSEVMWSMSPTTQKIELNLLYEYITEIFYYTWAYMDCQQGGPTVSCRMIRNDLVFFICVPLLKKDCILGYDFSFCDQEL
jgi:hypothetical protein